MASQVARRKTFVRALSAIHPLRLLPRKTISASSRCRKAIGAIGAKLARGRIIEGGIGVDGTCVAQTRRILELSDRTETSPLLEEQGHDSYKHE